MPAPASSSTPLYLRIDGAGVWSTTIPYDITEVGTRAATDMLELAVAQAVEWFIDAYMPMRFNRGYAREHLGYKILGSTYLKKLRRSEKLNRDAIDPNVWTGATKRAALFARPETRAVGGRRQMTIGCRIRMNLPSYLNQQRGQVTNQVLRKITKDEGAKIATHFFQAVIDMVSRYERTSTMTRDGKIKVRTSLSKSSQSQVGRTNRATFIANRRASMMQKEA